MKNIRREGYFQKKHAKYAGDKWNSRKLDRKSSRGMIYENEELRLRTININAEVERGQSDIRKLRRENEQLRREIWSLRDEYDRLNKLLKTHKTTDNDGNNSGSSHTEESDSCDTCKEEDIEEEIDEGECLENNCNKNKQQQQQHDNINNQEIFDNYENSQKSLEQYSSTRSHDYNNSPTLPRNSCKQQKENLHVNFDHLSIVSEENCTNSDGNSVQQGDMEADTSNATQSPIEKNSSDQQRAMNRLSDIQSIAPPLSHFENIAYDKLGPNISEDNNYSTSTTTTGETIVPANGWDFSVSSPYSLHAGHCSSAGANSSNAIVKSTSVETKNSACFSQKSPKHFFSPIKPRIRIEPRKKSTTINNGPDVFVSNALASPYHRQNLIQQQQLSSLAPVETFASIHHQTNTSRTISPVPFQRGGNLEDLLSDIETLSNDILQMQLEKQKSYSQEKLSSCESFTNRKPYRSEMNLVLTYNGNNPVITPITKNTVSSSATALGTTNPYAMDTPPPNLPEPMILFPQNLTYLGLENSTHPSAVVSIAAAAAQLVPLIQQQQDHVISGEQQYSTVSSNFSSDKATIHVPTTTICDISTDPTLAFLQDNLTCKGSSGGMGENDTERPSETLSTVMRRKMFAKRMDDSQCSRSFDSKLTSLQVPAISERSKMTRAESSTSENANCDVQSSSGSETSKRKSRRVSILFKKSPEDKIRDRNKDNENDKDKKNEDMTILNKYISRDQHSESAVNLSLAAAQSVDNLCKKPIIGITTHSTPNSPHSGGRRSNSAHHHHSHHHHHHQHGHHHQHNQHHQASSGQKINQELGTNKSPSGDGGGGTGGAVQQQQQQQQQQDQQQKSKSSRRHSDGTVIQTSVPSVGGVTLSSSHHGINDSYHEPGTSVSERNSNSLASSRESSTSLSMRSQRRKISVSSHNGGKIPWCGCWGNGCV